ncbi:unnamed protein product [Vicia faba]|uniref:Uncharacterized protein n=1 Tax=Vicia faba TaxID=3906 RepID=A0AAV0Z5P9_VICFA|nr:unnamed protein product [Vicia faba]
MPSEEIEIPRVELCNFVLYIVVISDATNFVISPCVSPVASGGRCSDERVLMNGGGGPDEGVLKLPPVVLNKKTEAEVLMNGGRGPEQEDDGKW